MSDQSKFNLISGIGTGTVATIILKLFNLVAFNYFSADMFKLWLLLIITIYAGQKAVNTVILWLWKK